MGLGYYEKLSSLFVVKFDKIKHGNESMNQMRVKNVTRNGPYKNKISCN